MELRKFIEEKGVRDGKICQLWVESAIRYRYQKGVVAVPIRQRQSGTGTDASRNPDFCTLALLSPKFVH